jgi:hypothetical protein
MGAIYIIEQEIYVCETLQSQKQSTSTNSVLTPPGFDRMVNGLNTVYLEEKHGTSLVNVQV